MTIHQQEGVRSVDFTDKVKKRYFYMLSTFYPSFKYWVEIKYEDKSKPEDDDWYDHNGFGFNQNTLGN